MLKYYFPLLFIFISCNNMSNYQLIDKNRITPTESMCLDADDYIAINSNSNIDLKSDSIEHYITCFSKKEEFSLKWENSYKIHRTSYFQCRQYSDNYLFAHNADEVLALNAFTGDEEWKNKSDFFIVNNNKLLTKYQDTIRLINLDSKAVIWSKKTLERPLNYIINNTFLAYGNNTKYGEHIIVYDINSGEKIKEIKIEGLVMPLYPHTTIGDQVLLETKDSLVLLRFPNGEAVWKISKPFQNIFYNYLFVDNRIIVNAQDLYNEKNRLFALNTSNGNLEWSSETQIAYMHKPSLSANSLIIANSNSDKILSISTNDGSLIEELNLHDQNSSVSTVFSHEHYIIYALIDGGVYFDRLKE